MTEFKHDNQTIRAAQALLKALKANSPESDAEGWVTNILPGLQEIASQVLEPETGLPDDFGPKLIDGSSDY